MRGVAWPSVLKYTDVDFGLSQHSLGGPDGARQQRYGLGRGARWVGALQTAPMSLTSGRTLRAWLHSLRGPSGTFYYPPPTTITGTSTGAFASVSGSSISLTGVSGWPNILVSGYAVVPLPSGVSQLVQIVRVVSGGGTATPVLKCQPPLRETPTVGATVTFGAVSALMRLASATPKVPLRLDRALPVQIQFEEAY